MILFNLLNIISHIINKVIELAYKQTEPIIYLIQNADRMSLNAKNSLLKLVEEPPNNAYVFMELQQMENTFDAASSAPVSLSYSYFPASPPGIHLF